ncbi:hypothetical protein ACG7TL_001354 [Trametes sanguinea]
MSVDGPGVPESVFIHNYLHLAGVAVLYYDFFLTFGEEYVRVWKNPRTISSILFGLNRYLPILGDIAVNTGNFHIFPNEQGAIRLAVSWESLFAFDLMIFTLTVCKTFRERYRHRITSGRHDIISLILRDGALYFAVMASVNFANTLTFYFLESSLPPAMRQPLLRGCLSTFASSISVTMMSRLMLNLHSSALGRDLADSSSGYPTTSENITPMFFTSRISMPAAGLTTTFNAPPDAAAGGDLSFDLDHPDRPRPARGRGHGFRDGVYVRELGEPSGSGGYIEEYELQDVRYRGDDDDDARDAALKDGMLQV